jgi:hypothetical protein
MPVAIAASTIEPAQTVSAVANRAIICPLIRNTAKAVSQSPTWQWKLFDKPTNRVRFEREDVPRHGFFLSLL